MTAATHHDAPCPLASIERDPSSGLPLAFRLLALGDNELWLDGQPATLRLTPALRDSLLARHAARGLPVPVDVEHRLYQAAQAAGQVEDGLAPALAERLTLGFVHLEGRADGLWARVWRWTPRGAAWLAEGLWRYVSPVLRGLDGPTPWLSSVALTNTPALVQQEPLVASSLSLPVHQPQGVIPMENPWPELARLPGCAEWRGAAPEQPPPGWLERLRTLAQDCERWQALETRVQALLARLREPLGLGDGADLPLLEGRALALSEQLSRDGAALLAEREARQRLQNERDGAEREDLLRRGLAEGKLTPALVERWARQQSVATLSAFLAHAPAGALVPLGQPPPPPRELAHDPRLTRVARACGVDPAKVLALKA